MSEINPIWGTSIMPDAIQYDLTPISRAQEMDYGEVTVKMYEFKFLDNRFHVILYDNISDDIERYLSDLENDLYGTRSDVICEALRRRYVGLDESLIDVISNNSSTSLSHSLNNALDEVDKVLEPIVTPRRERKEREDKLNSILRGKT